MKTAKGAAGESITASATAPAQAVCPGCGGPVVLRSRRIMSSRDRSYFWRHADNSKRQCPLRKGPVS